MHWVFNYLVGEIMNFGVFVDSSVALNLCACPFFLMISCCSQYLHGERTGVYGLRNVLYNVIEDWIIHLSKENWSIEEWWVPEWCIDIWTMTCNLKCDWKSNQWNWIHRCAKTDWANHIILCVEQSYSEDVILDLWPPGL